MGNKNFFKKLLAKVIYSLNFLILDVLLIMKGQKQSKIKMEFGDYNGQYNQSFLTNEKSQAFSLAIKGVNYETKRMAWYLA